MHVTRTNLPHSQVKLAIELDVPKMAGYFAQAYERLAPAVTIKGFRPGAAPKNMVMERIGLDRYTQEAVNLALGDTYYQAIHQEKLLPLAPPAIAVHSFGIDSALTFDATVDVLPSIDPGTYQALTVNLPTESTEAADEEVETVLKRLRQQAATVTDVERGAHLGDRIEIHFTGTVKGVVQDDLTSQHYPAILGETPLIPGFEQELIGLKKGDEKSFTLKVDAPSTKRSSAADKLKEKLGFGARQVAFTVECLQVQQMDPPELTDDFAKNFGHDSIGPLKEAIKAGVGREKQEQLRHRQEEAILNALRESIKVELPKTLVEQEISRRVEHLRTQFGKAFEVFLKDRHEHSLEKLRESVRPEAERSVSAGLILGEVAQREGFVPKGGARTNEQQREIMTKTLDRLIEYAGGKKF